MTRKRFIKLALSERMTRNEAVFAADCALKLWRNYQTAYDSMHGIIKGRFEIYIKKTVV